MRVLNIKYYITFYLLIFSISKGTAQEILTLDLSNNDQITETVIPSAKYKIKIINKLPDTKYNIIIEIKDQIPEPLNSDPISKPAPSPDALGKEKCDIVKEIETQLNKKYTTEKEISEVIENVQEKIDKLNSDTNQTSCTPEQIMFTENELNIFRKRTSETLKKQYKLKKNQILEVRITRNINGKVKVSKYSFTTAKKGQWFTSYGFSFITHSFNNENNYFLKSMDNEFIITKENDRKKLEFVPSIFFTYMPQNHLSRDVSVGLSAGLGFDLDAPTVFLGASFFFNYNIGLVIGVTAHKQRFLNGEYEAGQIVMENLNDDQLHEELYTVNPFVSITFRFGKNIFNNSNDSNQE